MINIRDENWTDLFWKNEFENETKKVGFRKALQIYTGPWSNNNYIEEFKKMLSAYYPQYLLTFETYLLLT